MAGIGFALRALSGRNTLSSVVGAAGHAAVIAAGPWLFTIASLAAITASSEPLAGHDTLATFRALIIYAFATSLVLAAPSPSSRRGCWPISSGSARPISVRPLLVAAMALALLVVSIGVAGAGRVFRRAH